MSDRVFFIERRVGQSWEQTHHEPTKDEAKIDGLIEAYRRSMPTVEVRKGWYFLNVSDDDIPF